MSLFCKLGFHKFEGSVRKVVVKPSYKGRKPHKYVKKYAICKRCGKTRPCK